MKFFNTKLVALFFLIISINYKTFASDTTNSKNLKQSDYSIKEAELAKKEKELTELEHKNELNKLKNSIESIDTKVNNFSMVVPPFITLISLLIGFYLVIISRQQKRIDDQQFKLEKRQEELDNIMKRVLLTEDMGIKLREKKRLYVIRYKNEPIPTQLERLFGSNPEKRVFKNINNECNVSALSEVTLPKNIETVVLINSKQESKQPHFSDEDVNNFYKEILSRNIGFMIIGTSIIDNTRVLNASANMYSQVYQNLMNLLKFQAILDNDFDIV